jgi:hypothetical protein
LDGPAAAHKALDLHDGQDAALQAAAEKSKCAAGRRVIPPVLPVLARLRALLKGIELTFLGVSATMKEHSLTFDIAVSEESGTCEWTLSMNGLLVSRGQEDNPNKLFTTQFYEDEMAHVKVSRYYHSKYFL